MRNSIKKILEENNIDYCFSDEKIPHLPNDKQINGRWNEETLCKNHTWEGKNIGVVFKYNGIKLKCGNYAVCIDIDAKKIYGNTEEEQLMLFEKVRDILKLNKRYPHFERTVSGGYHIWLKSSIEDIKKISNKSIIVESFFDAKENKKRIKKEIEVFTHSRYMILYKDIDFSDLDLVDYKTIDMLHILQEEEEKNIKYEENEDINKTSKDSLLKKAKKDIPAIREFSEGVWAGYNFVKDEIMRFYITLNQEHDFLETINQFHSQHFSEWKNFPEHYLRVSNNNRKPSKNTKHLEWLKDIGYYKALKPTKEDKIKTSDLESLYQNAIVINDSAVFLWDGKSYRVADPEGTKNKICERLESKGIYTNEDLLNEAYMRVYRLAVINGESYNFESDRNFIDRVPLTFNNGTLYIYPDKSPVFKEGEFLKSNKCFTHFTIDFTEDIFLKKDYSIFEEWISSKFSTEHEIAFFKMCLGDLFVTANNSELLPYFYGDAGVGKSILIKVFEDILKPGSTSALSVNQFNDRFSKIALMKSCINFSSEISKRTINTDVFKKIISREAMEMEYKGINGVMGKPLSKHLAIANSLPDVDVDCGVERRFAIIEIKQGKIRPDLSSNEFKFKMQDDKNSLIQIVITGIVNLMRIDFDLREFYNKHIDKKYKKEFVVKNNQVAHFIETCFDFSPAYEGYTTTEVMKYFELFRKTYAGMGINQMKLTTLGARLSEAGLTRKTVRFNGGTTKKYTGINIKTEWLEAFKSDLQEGVMI